MLFTIYEKTNNEYYLCSLLAMVTADLIPMYMIQMMFSKQVLMTLIEREWTMVMDIMGITDMDITMIMSILLYLIKKVIGMEEFKEAKNVTVFQL